jgi:charged multivesicular body protein 6
MSSYPRAILDLKLQRDKLHQYQRRIVLLTDKETDIARQMLAAGDKKRALLALRRKKYQEQLLAKTDAQLAQLEQLTRNVEFALIQKDVVFGLQQGTRVLKEIHAEMGGIEHVEKLMGETADAIAYQKVRKAHCPLPTHPFSSIHEKERVEYNRRRLKRILGREGARDSRGNERFRYLLLAPFPRPPSLSLCSFVLG